ncbi:MAG: hypothetical protein R3B99_22110 [Polyangiales bacterium]
MSARIASSAKRDFDRQFRVTLDGDARLLTSMTTVTESVKRVLEADDLSALREGDLERICADPVLAQRFARRLAGLARQVAPGREWTPEDLRDVLEVAVHGSAQQSARVLEGRYFRKRLREQIGLADRYGDSFAIVVLTVTDGVADGVYSSVLDAVTERLRKTDFVFLYRRRFALLLPRMRSSGLEPLIRRVRELVAVGAGSTAIERIASMVYPEAAFDDGPTEDDGARVLDWAEDQLR